MKNTIAIFCGANDPRDPQYVESAKLLAYALVHQGYKIVTGGGDLGLMRVFNESAMEAGGEAIGVIPRFMVERGWGHKGLSATHVVETMQERKLVMSELAETAVIAYPGGVGTYDELFEFIALRKLGVWQGKILVYNILGYFDPFIDMISRAVDDGFMAESALGVYTIVDNPQDALAALDA